MLGWHLIDISEIVSEATLSVNAGPYVKPFPVVKVKNKNGEDEDDVTGLLRPAMVSGVTDKNGKWQDKLWGIK